MKQQIFSIHDAAAGAYLAPFFMTNGAQAIRAFSVLCNTDDHMFKTSPHDFILFRMGIFDADNGEFEIYEAPEKIRHAIEVIDRPHDVTPKKEASNA